MNIFILDKDIQKCAEYLCDKHCVKMVLESAQMLSTAHRVLDKDVDPIFYKVMGKNHPCNIWVRQSDSNYEWLYRLFLEQAKEYTYRYGKTHLSDTKLREVAANLPKNIPTGPLTPFAQAMPDKYRREDPVEAYRTYYIKDKATIAWWIKNRSAPFWFVDGINNEVK